MKFCSEVANKVPYYAIIADFPKMQLNCYDTLIYGVNINSVTLPNSKYVEITWRHHQVVQPTIPSLLVIKEQSQTFIVKRRMQR